MSLHDEFKTHFENLDTIRKKDMKNKANIMQTAVNLVGLVEEMREEKQSEPEEVILTLPAKKQVSSHEERYEEVKQQLAEYLLTYAVHEADLELLQKMKLYLELLDMFLVKEPPIPTQEELKKHYKNINGFTEAYQKKTGKNLGKRPDWKQALEILNQSLKSGEITSYFL